MPIQVDDSTVIQHAIENAMNELGVAQPGIVVSYANGKATVKPGVYKLLPALDDDDIDAVEETPNIPDVPVLWPRGRNFSIAGTLSPGDPVLLVCLDRDPSGWRASGQPSEPSDTRVHHWSNAVAIPGLLSNRTAFPPLSDAPALASKMDAIFQAISTIAAVVTPADAITALNTIVKAVQAEYPTPEATAGSSVVKVSG